MMRGSLPRGIVEKNPAASLKFPRAIGSRAPVFMTLDETRKLLDTAKLPRDVALFWSLAYGLRIAELTAQKIGDVAAPNGSGMGALMVRGKGNKA
jgi:site-specific recombinase XerD